MAASSVNQRELLFNAETAIQGLDAADNKSELFLVLWNDELLFTAITLDRDKDCGTPSAAYLMRKFLKYPDPAREERYFRSSAGARA